MIYAVNKRTKEHVLWPPQPHKRGRCDEWVYIQAAPDGWIEWHATSGAKSPVANRNGCGLAVMRLASGEEVDAVGYWDDTPLPKYRVVAYRPILAQPDIDITRLVTERHPPAWDGDGQVEAGMFANCTRYANPVMVKFVGSKFSVVESDFGDECAMETHLLRPIRSEEDRVIEEMVRIIMDVPEDRDDRQDSTNIARALYRAGYRKTGGE